MNLTKEQQDILDGKQGDVLAKVMQTLVRYGEVFGADAMVPVTSKYNHLVTSFGLKALAPVYELMDKLIESGNVSKQKFSADPRPLDPNVPSSFLQNFVFKNFMYSKQEDYEKQLEQIGIMDKDAYTCTCYMDEVGNTPAMGEVLSWSESSAVVYANSVLGARCNRNSGIDLFWKNVSRFFKHIQYILPEAILCILYNSFSCSCFMPVFYFSVARRMHI